MLVMNITKQSRFVLVRPHYPENVGAAARAMKTMGVTRLVLVKPGRLAVPDHEMAYKMAVKSWDVLGAAETVSTLEEAVSGISFVYGTTSHRGVSGVLTARDAASRAAERAERGESLAFVFGNEKTGLSAEDSALCGARVRIPMAADQPSINLAQAVQVMAYELFLAGLALRK